ncbi:MAG: hypothetical protein ABI389_01720 [Rhodanobacter sp.]
MTSTLPSPHCRAMRTNIDRPDAPAVNAHRVGLIEPEFGHIQPCGLR